MIAGSCRLRIFNLLSTKVSRFISPPYKISNKIIYNVVREFQKTIKKSMATGTAQKSCTALFPLWSLGKSDIPTMK